MSGALRVQGFFAVALMFIASLTPACGSRQRVDVVEEEVIVDFDCISDRWASPPPQVGQTPPDDFPTAADVDPFIEGARPAPRPTGSDDTLELPEG